MKTAFSQVLIRWLLIFVLVVLSACSQSDENVLETPTTAAPVAGEPQQSDADVPPEKACGRTLGDVHSGEATYYRATGKGNCSFDTSDDFMVAAINSVDYATAAMCGAYIEVSGPDGMVTVRVVDRCPGCKQDALDLSRQAFARIASHTAGRVPVSWQIVAGPVAGPIIYHYMDGTTRYWTAIQVRNHRWPVAQLEIMPKGATDWIRLERRTYNYFVHPKPIAAGPVRVRVTALTGDTLEDELPEPEGGIIVRGAAQFK